jgi:hypothetical protein
MVQNDPAKKKLLGSKVEILSFLLGKSVQGLFVDPKTHEGVGMKARGMVAIESQHENRSDRMFSGICEPKYNELQW